MGGSTDLVAAEGGWRGGFPHGVASVPERGRLRLRHRQACTIDSARRRQTSLLAQMIAPRGSGRGGGEHTPDGDTSGGSGVRFFYRAVVGVCMVREVADGMRRR